MQERVGLPVWVQAVGARFSLLFGLDREPTSYRQAARLDVEMATRFYAAAIEHGVYFHDGWRHGLSAMHTQEDIERALAGLKTAARRVAGG